MRCLRFLWVLVGSFCRSWRTVKRRSISLGFRWFRSNPCCRRSSCRFSWVGPAVRGQGSLSVFYIKKQFACAFLYEYNTNHYAQQMLYISGTPPFAAAGCWCLHSALKSPCTLYNQGGNPDPGRKMRRDEVLPPDGVRWAVRMRKEGESLDPAEADHLYPETQKGVSCPWCEKSLVGTSPHPPGSESAPLHLGSRTVEYTENCH